jgi:lipopolysaccharide/colanic/teichoic acid biosynthesis glycosyltransferase
MYVDPAAEELRKQKMVKFMKEGVKANGSGKVVDESQVTPVGRFLRSTSLDEIPQLINVMLGQMSIVGPRPSLPYEYENMQEWQRERFRVMPGCTGFWQVYGRGRTSFDEMCMMDIYMIENMSPWFYLQIVLKTIPVLILGKGAK